MFKIDQFTILLRKAIDSILDDDIIAGRDKSEILGDSEWTYLINNAIYSAVKKYNKKFHTHLSLVPETGGRMPSDFLLKNKLGRNELFVEHENNLDMKKVLYNYKKLIKSRAKEKLLICYAGKKTTPDLVLAKLRLVKKTNNKPIHVLVAYKCYDNLFQESKQFNHEIL